jgi:hypothetical protein
MPERLLQLLVVGLLMFAEVSCTKKGGPISQGFFSAWSAAMNDPPVKIVGGSMTFRTDTWTAGTGAAAGTYSTPVSDASYIELRGVPTQGGPFRISVPWMIELDARSSDGKTQNQYQTGVWVCSQSAPNSSSGCNINGTNLSNTVYIGPKDPQSKGVKFSGIFSRPTDWDSPGQFVRYVDPTQGCAGSLCEHIWKVTVSYMQAGTRKDRSYLCPDGRCQIYIGQ